MTKLFMRLTFVPRERWGMTKLFMVKFEFLLFSSRTGIVLYFWNVELSTQAGS